MMTNSIAHYKILEKLGAGEVCLAEDTLLGRKVALKDRTLRYQTARDFLADLRAVAQSSTPQPHPLSAASSRLTISQ